MRTYVERDVRTLSNVGNLDTFSLGTRRVPVEIKAGVTVARDAFRGLDHYLSLSGDPAGVLVYGGDASYRRGRHLVRSWWHCG